MNIFENINLYALSKPKAKVVSVRDLDIDLYLIGKSAFLVIEKRCSMLILRDSSFITKIFTSKYGINATRYSYLNKDIWIQVSLKNNFDFEDMKKCIDNSYQSLFDSILYIRN